MGRHYKCKDRQGLDSLYAVPNATYVLDTSGIISLSYNDPVPFATFLGTRKEDIIIPSELIPEIEEANARFRNTRHRVLSDELTDLVLSTERTQRPRYEDLASQSDYDLHRWLGVKSAYEACEAKKCEQDLISVEDSHVVAAALTASFNNYMHGSNDPVVVLTKDGHIRDSVTYLKNSVYGPCYPGVDMTEMISPPPECVEARIPKFANVRIPNINKLIGR